MLEAQKKTEKKKKLSLQTKSHDFRSSCFSGYLIISYIFVLGMALNVTKYEFSKNNNDD